MSLDVHALINVAAQQMAFEIFIGMLTRAVIFVVGMAVMIHFVCMSILINGSNVPSLDALLIAITGASGFGTALHALGSDQSQMLLMLTATAALLACFVLLIWCRGFYVSLFYKRRFKRKKA